MHENVLNGIKFLLSFLCFIANKFIIINNMYLFSGERRLIEEKHIPLVFDPK